MTEGVFFRDPLGIASAFAIYYKNVNTPSKDSSFDEYFYDKTESYYTAIKTEFSQLHEELPDGHIFTNDILAVLNKLKRRKASRPGPVTYDRLIFGGDPLNMSLIKLFDLIVYIGKIPE